MVDSNSDEEGYLDAFKAFELGRDSTKLILSIYKGLETPLALHCADLFRKKKYSELVALGIEDVLKIGNQSADVFRRNLQAVSLLSKAEWLDLGVDKKSVAFIKWQETERHCAHVNRALRKIRWPNKPYLSKIIQSWRSEIARTLKEFDFDYMLKKSSWGPGSTASLRGSDVSRETKYSAECGITKRLYDLMAYSHQVPLASIWDIAFPMWKPEFTQVNAAAIDFVPKTAKTYRTICIEPGLNMYIQKGIGSLIAKRLSQRYGYDFRKEAQTRNLSTAQDFSYATVDFSAASDLISTELVRLLLPEVWFKMLDAARTHKVLCADGSEVPLSKFSSMGNGFTFELETVIFRSLARICVPSDEEVFCFGDDVLVPVKYFPRFCRLSQTFGFRVNPTKSFSREAPFRESCGGYFYFDGLQVVDVKPFFIKTLPNAILDLYKIANRWRASYAQDKTWDKLVRYCPYNYRTPIPINSGDGGFAVVGAIPKCFCKLRKIGTPLPDAHEGVWYRSWVLENATQFSGITHGVLLARLHKASTEIAIGNQIVFRDDTRIRAQWCRSYGGFSDLRGFFPFE